MGSSKIVFGPWPQPAPDFFEGAAPAVANVPDEVQRDWDLHVGLRYAKQLATETIPAFLWARRNPGLLPVSDERFVEILCDGIFSKLLVEEGRFDPPDLSVFRDYLDGTRGPGPAARGWFKIDLSPMRYVPTEDDSASTAAVVLLRRHADERYELVAIALEDAVFDPTMQGAWTTAKYFALQGAGVVTTILMHPMLHFPSNAVDAITRTRLSDEGPLKQFLLPHFRLAMAVNYSVLYGQATVLKLGQVYSPYPGTLKENAEVVATLWRGLEHPDGTPNRAYPRYALKLQAPVIHSPYGAFLARYRDVLLWMCRQVVARVTLSAEVASWADHCAYWLPGFPDAAAIRADSDTLAQALASILLDVSVAHSADHYIYAQVNEREVPFRLHAEIPQPSDVAEPDLRTLTTWRDNLNSRMCSLMFFKPYTLSHLVDVDYGFSDGDLRAANIEFRSKIAGMDAELESAGVPVYTPASELATSVQY